MKLSEIIKDFKVIEVKGNTDIEISNLAFNSRTLQENGLFFCIKGLKSDGHAFAKVAAEIGAKAIVSEKYINLPNDITQIIVEDTSLAMAYLSNCFYGHPAEKLSIIGITGTNGKTTTTHLIEHLHFFTGKKTGIIGTLYIQINKISEKNPKTTPESLELAKTFHKMKSEGVTLVTMEVSSHALSQKRTFALPYRQVIFTNLTQDHLDYHHTMEEYFQSKLTLFTNKNGKTTTPTAIINIDDNYGKRILEITPFNTVTYAVNNDKADIKAENIKLFLDKTEFTLVYNGNKHLITIPLTGKFNVYNTLASIASGIDYNIPISDIISALKNFPQVKGRFQKVDVGQNFMVIVDYAHTPDGFENVLKTAREITNKNIITVFGCGGDRDQAKRPIMGEIAARYSDICIITADNPRNEDPKNIMKNIEEGLNKHNKPYHLIEDREEGINKAMSIAQKGDLVLLLGKGHENYQIYKDKTFWFDDSEISKKIINKMK